MEFLPKLPTHKSKKKYLKKGYVSGPSLKEPIPDCSLAEYFIPLLKSHPADNIIQVEAVTGRTDTSRELLTKSLKVCEGFRRLGLSQNDVFCIFSRNTSDLFSAVLGVWWLGGALAPFDLQWNVAEMTNMFEKLQPSVVICEEVVLEKMLAVTQSRGRDVKMIVLAEKDRVKAPNIPFEDLLDIEVDVDNYQPMPVECPSEKVVLISPTSGSTGSSKAVGLTHRNLVFQHLVFKQSYEEYFWKNVLLTSHAHWVSFSCHVILALATGMKMIYITDTTISSILRAVDEHKPEWFVLGAGHFSHLMREPDIGRYDFSSVKAIELVGSVLTEAIPGLMKTVGKKVNLRNMYGSTEASGIVCRAQMNEEITSVGKPVVGHRLKVVDLKTGTSLGPNQTGEIWISSPGVMKGYIGDEEETKAVLSDGWFRTGDVGYYDETGNFRIVDRMKEMMKDSHDRQIAPSEIEGVIESVAGVREAGVVGILADGFELRLVGLVVKEKSSVTEEDVKKAVKDKLADYKQLQRVFFVDGLPRTNVGKLKRKALKEMATSLVNASQG